VPDPYSTTGGQILVTASLRDDPLGRLFARRHIDEGQYRAGLKLLELFGLAEIGSVQGMDPSKEPVDGRGAFVEAITDSHIRAARQLAPCAACGGHGFGGRFDHRGRFFGRGRFIGGIWYPYYGYGYGYGYCWVWTPAGYQWTCGDYGYGY
jgi:hypothetical protein